MATDQEAKSRAASLRELVNELRQDINKEYPNDPLRFGNDPQLAPVVLPTGIEALDHILDGGVQKGQLTLVTGAYSSGKTTLGLIACREAQKRGEIAAIIDAERAYNPDWAEKLGVDVSALLVTQPRTGERGFDIAKTLIERGIGVIVIDSLIAMVPSKEFKDDQQTPGDQARMLNRGIRGMLGALTEKKTAVIMINQVRLGIGVMFGNPEFIPGGKGQEFYAYQIIRCRRGPWIEEGEGKDKHRAGFLMKFKAEKSKAGEPFRTCEVPFKFSGIFDTEAAFYDTALRLGFIVRRGSSYSVPGVTEKSFFGIRKLKEYFAERPEKFEDLRRRVFADGRSMGEGIEETGETASEDESVGTLDTEKVIELPDLPASTLGDPQVTF